MWGNLHTFGGHQESILSRGERGVFPGQYQTGIRTTGKGANTTTIWLFKHKERKKERKSMPHI